jgi:hypothetical protein
MKIAIHQPNFLPWEGYFRKMHEADIFVYLDDVEFTRGDYINRTLVRDEKYLTVPVEAKNHQLVKEVTLYRWVHHKNKIIKRLRQEYGYESFPGIRYVLGLDYELLCRLNIDLINILYEKLYKRRPHRKTVLSSTLGVHGKGTERLLSIITKLGGTEYICGKGSKEYQEDNILTEQGIKVTRLDNSKLSPYCILSKLKNA